MVSIQDANGYLKCGGSIVASNRIVTAAHCFTDIDKKEKLDKEQIQSFKIVAGTSNPFGYQGKNDQRNLLYLAHGSKGDKAEI